MPVVINGDLSSIDSPIRDLIPLVPGVLQNAAPERNVEFETLYNRLAWRFEMKTESGRFGFGADTLENPHRNVIYVPLAAMERTWAYVYSYLFLFDAVKQHESIEITRDANLSVRKAFDLLNWANAGERRKKRLKWCSNLPRPNDEKMDKERFEKTNRFFLGVLAFILLHEVGHIDEKHTLKKDVPDNESQNDELAADQWAAKWLLNRCGNYNPNPDFRINRCNWVMLALSILNFVEFNNRRGLATSHPPTLQRILLFSHDFSPESPEHIAPTTDFPLWLASVIIECQSLNLRIGTRLRTFATITERLMDQYRNFEDRYQT